jgi:hypothetical protein
MPAAAPRQLPPDQPELPELPDEPSAAAPGSDGSDLLSEPATARAQPMAASSNTPGER